MYLYYCLLGKVCERRNFGVEKKYSEREYIQEARYFKIWILIWAVMSLWNCVNERDVSYFDLKLCIRTVTV